MLVRHGISLPTGVSAAIHLNGTQVLGLAFQGGRGVLKDIGTVQDTAGRVGLLRVRLRPCDTVGDDGNCSWPDGDGVDNVVLAFVDEFTIAEDIHEVELEVAQGAAAPGRGHTAAACGDEEVGFGERVGALVSGEGAAGVIVG